MKKTHCVNGHAFTKKNTRLVGNTRHCRHCGNQRQKRYLSRKTAVK